MTQRPEFGAGHRITHVQKQLTRSKPKDGDGVPYSLSPDERATRDGPSRRPVKGGRDRTWCAPSESSFPPVAHGRGPGVVLRTRALDGRFPDAADAPPTMCAARRTPTRRRVGRGACDLQSARLDAEFDRGEAETKREPICSIRRGKAAGEGRPPRVYLWAIVRGVRIQTQTLRLVGGGEQQPRRAGSRPAGVRASKSSAFLESHSWS